MVTRPSSLSASKRSPTASARADSLAPHVRKTRLEITDVAPPARTRAMRSGRIARSNMSVIS